MGLLGLAANAIAIAGINSKEVITTTNATNFAVILLLFQLLPTLIVHSPGDPFAPVRLAGRFFSSSKGFFIELTRRLNQSHRSSAHPHRLRFAK